jgi:hypothetical protein
MNGQDTVIACESCIVRKVYQQTTESQIKACFVRQQYTHSQVLPTHLSSIIRSHLQLVLPQMVFCWGLPEQTLFLSRI